MVIVDVLNLYVIKCVDSILEVVVDRQSEFVWIVDFFVCVFLSILWVIYIIGVCRLWVCVDDLYFDFCVVVVSRISNSWLGESI